MSAGDSKFGLEISKGVTAKFVMAAIGFVGSVVFARVLGASGYGSFYIITTLVNVLDNPVTGWGNACKKRITETDFPTSEALGAGLISAIVLPCIIIPLVYASQVYTDLYNISGLVLPFSILFIAICIFAVTNRILSGRYNFSAANWADTLRSLFTTPLQLVFVSIGWGVAGMVYGLALATALTIPYVIYKIGIKPSRPSRSSLASIVSYAKYSVPSGFVGSTMSRVDILLLGAFLSSSAVGVYQVSVQLTMAGLFIGGVAQAGLMGRVSNNWSKNNKKQIVDDVTNSLGYVSVLSIPIFFGTVAMPNDLLVTIFGSEYSGVGSILISLALFTVLKTQSTQLRSTVAGIDRPDIITVIKTTALILNVGIGYLLLIEYGIIGVVIATIFSQGLQYISFAYITKQYLPEISLFPNSLQYQLLSGIIMFALVKYAHTLMDITWWGEIAFLIGLGGFTYFTILSVISKSFRATVQGILSDIDI